jgi:hypothetical protein
MAKASMFKKMPSPELCTQSLPPNRYWPRLARPIQQPDSSDPRSKSLTDRTQTLGGRLLARLVP